jgi:hypothetical protein
MNKQLRQYFGLFSAIAAYYLIHEGAHLLCALFMGVFKQIQFLGLGVQIDVYAQAMHPAQLGVFCLVGSAATALTGWILTVSTDRITSGHAPVFMACMYYITIAMLLIDPLYLSVLYRFFGGGDMNGISYLLPEAVARCIFGCIFAINTVLFFKIVLPKYKKVFH